MTEGCKNSSLVPETTDESKQIIEYLEAHGFEKPQYSEIQSSSSSRMSSKNNVKTLAEVKKIVEHFEELSKLESMLYVKSNSKNSRIQMPVCQEGEYHVQDVAAGLFSTWAIDISVAADHSISNVQAYTLGTPIGWSWDQKKVNYYGYMGFCITGTVTIGIDLGTMLPTTRTMMYNLRVTMLDDCKATLRQSFGSC